MGLQQGRLAIVTALSGLPVDSKDFYAIEDFDQALFNRIGENFSLSYPPSPPYFLYTASAKEKEQALDEWHTKLRESWQKKERPWLEKAFTTWLYFLGLVELAVSNGAPVAFCLTDMGQAVFHSELQDLVRSEEANTKSPDQPAWLVQPNFDVVVYLDHVSPPQLAFIERHAERKQAHQHTAHYLLTRESVYRGLESGTTITEILEGLQAGFQNELPQNVIVELREWAALCERIVLHRRAQLLEFPDARALQESLSQRNAGRVVGDRFLLIESGSAPHTRSKSDRVETIDYAQALPKNLDVSEDGIISLYSGDRDLIVHAQLDQWAVRLSDTEWHLTAEKLTSQLKTGRKVAEFIGLLNERLTHPLPPLLEIALRSWAGETYPVELDSVVVLRCAQENLYRAISTSQRMGPFLKGSIPPNLLIIDATQLETFRAQLNWLGCSISEQLSVIPLKRK
jgi:hypothetical protein